jgi:CBS-domain-containing membrane protein
MKQLTTVCSVRTGTLVHFAKEILCFHSQETRVNLQLKDVLCSLERMITTDANGLVRSVRQTTSNFLTENIQEIGNANIVRMQIQIVSNALMLKHARYVYQKLMITNLSHSSMDIV